MGVDPRERGLLPVACTLDAADGTRRLEEWRQVMAAAGAGRESGPGLLTLWFRDAAGVGAELQRLVAAEQACCSFLGWSAAREDSGWRVDVTGTDEELRALPFAR